jgi:hypothetical protein
VGARSLEETIVRGPLPTVKEVKRELLLILDLFKNSVARDRREQHKSWPQKIHLDKPKGPGQREQLLGRIRS